MTDSAVQAGIKGLFFDKLLGEEEFEDVVDMPFENHDEKIKLFLSSYTLNSFLHSSTEVLPLTNGWIKDAWIGNLITTWQLEPLLPGLCAKYGEDQPVDTYF